MLTYEIYKKGIKTITTVLNRSLTREQEEIYYMLLEDIEDKQFLLGIKKLLQDREFADFPRPATIRKYCLEESEKVLELEKEKEEKEIQLIKNKIKRALIENQGRQVIFDDPKIHVIIVDLGGFSYLGRLDVREFEYLLNSSIPTLYRMYKNTKFEKIKININSESNSNEILYIGDKNRCIDWTNKYKEIKLLTQKK